MVRVTEVDGDAEELLEASVVLPQKIVVGGHGEPFRVALLDAQARPLHIWDRDREYLFDERDAELPIGSGEEDSGTVPAGEYEVGLSVTHPLAPINDPWPYINEFSIR